MKNTLIAWSNRKVVVASLVSLVITAYMFSQYFFTWRLADPIVMADELLFARTALYPDQYPNVFSNQFFSVVYGSSAVCGADWLSCSRLIGSAIWVMLSVVVFLIATVFTNPRRAGLFAVFSGLAPTSILAFAFLPEVLYYLLILSGMGLVYLSIRNTNHLLGIVSGVVFGAAMVTKPHAIAAFTLAAIIYCILGITSRTHRVFSLKAFAGFLVTGLLIRSLVAFSISGPPGLDPLGVYADVSSSGISTVFGNLAETSLVGEKPISSILLDFFPNYLMVAAFLIYFGLRPFIFSLTGLRSGKSNELAKTAMVFWTIGLALGLAVASWIFAALITSTGDDHNGRILLRYFEFLIPLILGLWIWEAAANKGKTRQNWILAVEALSILYLFWYIASGQISTVMFQPSDNLWLLSFIDGQSTIGLLVALMVVVLVVRSLTKLGPAAIAVTLVFTAGSGLALTTNLGKYYSEQSPYGEIGQSLTGLGLAEDQVIFAGIDRVRMSTVQMTSMYVSSSFIGQEPFDQVSAEDKRYLVAYGEVYPEGEAGMIFKDGQIAVFDFEKSSSHHLEFVEFVNNDHVGVITSWGVWAQGSEMAIDLTELQSSGVTTLGLTRHPETTNELVLIHVVETSETIEVSLEEAGKIYTVQLALSRDAKTIVLKYSDVAATDAQGSQTEFGIGLAGVSSD